MIEYDEILELAEAQKEALLKGRLEKAVELQERRQRIIDKIQNVDREATSDHLFNPSTGKNDPVMEEFSQKIVMTIERILSLDSEMRTIIHAEMGSVSDKLETLQKIKAFCRNAAHHQAKRNLSVSV